MSEVISILAQLGILSYIQLGAAVIITIMVYRYFTNN
jgi:hypothetical protein